MRISPQGGEQRFSERAAQGVERVLQAAVPQVSAAAPVALPLLQRFTAVYIQDSPQVQVPAVLAEVGAGSGGGARAEDQTAALKLQGRLDLKRGALSGPCLPAGRASARTSPIQHAPLPAGSLRLADLGYFALDVLQTIAPQQAYCLTRLRAGTQVFTAQGPVGDLASWLRQQSTALVDVPVSVGTHHRLPCRGVAVRVPPEVATQRRSHLHADARRRGQAVSRARWGLADWTLFCTTGPSALLRGSAVVGLARVRGQIEVLFTLWKHEGPLAPSRSPNPWRGRCEG